jgi:prevent-host-death family protein
MREESSVNTQLIDVKNIHSLTEFKRRAAELVGELKDTSRPLVLTVNGRAEAVVLGTELYRRMVKLLEEADHEKRLDQALRAMDRGEGRPAREALAQIRRKYVRK